MKHVPDRVRNDEIDDSILFACYVTMDQFDDHPDMNNFILAMDRRLCGGMVQARQLMYDDSAQGNSLFAVERSEQ